ncbi:TonB-dependent receptor [uncultured Arcticibacterium sp.]|uniref:SusC/RagA family TonB-linked outer membrane protein n=1 Tax=uncultured Arcticibacterium sp. TaxID=2173042 RepID=UPI0030F4B4EA
MTKKTTLSKVGRGLLMYSCKSSTLKNVFSVLCLLLFVLQVEAAQSISGKVTDENGEGLPGVSVIEKGTTKGTTTDLEGNFKLETSSSNSVLVFSFIGYKSQELVAGNQSVINVSMVPDAAQLEEVVVVGYGTQKKETVVGSVASVQGAELIKSPAVNVSNSIAGRIPGVVAVNRSGEPGYDGSEIRIRGSNTLGNNSALIVIDGIPDRAGGFERLNPNDIESISVLKDASAAIYGARAANGVILVTTKRGKNGKPELSYQFNQGFSQPTKVPDLANARQYAEMLNDLSVYELPTSQWQAANDAYKATGAFGDRTAPYSPEDMELYSNGSSPWTHPDTDWYGETLKKWSPQSKHNIQLIGGGENVKYMTSLGYQKQDAYYKNSATGYEQYNLRINLDANINKYVDMQIGAALREEFRHYPTESANAIFRMSMRGKPNQPAFWPNGKPGPDIENGQNPVVVTTDLTGYDRDRTDYIQTNGSLNIKIPGVDGLKFTGTAAIDKKIRNRKVWRIPWVLYEKGNGFEADGVTPVLVPNQRGPAEPNLTQYNENQLNILLGGIGTYEKTWGDHSATILAGVNRETIEGDNFDAYRRYFLSPAIDQIFAGGDLEKNNGGGAFERARLNYFGRVAYNYKEKYLAEFLWRNDGSYIFPEETRFGFFPGFLAGWVMSEESFIKDNIPAISFLKLRGSWGQMGNDNIYYDDVLQEYQFLSTYGFDSYIINGAETKTLYETRVPNPGITWEVANNSNIGIEGDLFKSSLFFEFDLFYNKRTNILWRKNASVPQSTGLSLPAENIGEVANKGFDFNIGYRGRQGEVKYQVSLNGGYAKNKILFWDEAPGAPDWQRSTGKPINTFLVYQYDGVFKDQAEIDGNQLDYTALVNTLRPGDMKYQDYDGDGKITPDDRVRMDFNNIPLFQGGANLSVSYKAFDLSVLLQGAFGARQYISAGESGNIGNYFLDIYENRWTVDNPSSEHPRIANRSDQYFSGGNTYWFRKADYIRLKNFELGYTLPAAASTKIGLSNLRIYANGLNLFDFMNKLKVLDPESASSNGQYYPQARVLNTGISVTF